MRIIIFLAILFLSLDIYSKATPEIYNFRVENSNKNRVYFDVDGDITGLTTQGFVISGKTITGINTTGNYFTVSSPFTFWDNNTIRLNNGDGIVYNFTLSYINNNVLEPNPKQNTYYVSLTGDDNNSGKSEATAWRTISKAAKIATAGSIVWIKVGNYGNENIIINNSGTIDNPIKFIGYKKSIGDITTNYYGYKDGALQTSEMPTIIGLSRENGTGLYSDSNDYIIIKNIQIANYRKGIMSRYGYGFVIENCNTYDIGGEINQGYAINLIAKLTNPNDVVYPKSNYRLKNNIIVNGTAGGAWLLGEHNLFENNTVYCNEGVGSNAIAMDYYFHIRGGNNIIRNGHIERALRTISHGGHGYSIKSDNTLYNGQSILSEYNLVEKSTAKGITRTFQARNVGANHNVFKDCEAVGFGTTAWKGNGGGIDIFGGAQNNTFERLYIHNVETVINIFNNRESEINNKHFEGNIIRNCIFANSGDGIRFANESKTATFNNNNFNNNTFYKIHYLIRMNSKFTFSNNSFKNNIFSDILFLDNPATKLKSIGKFNYSYNNFYNGFSKPQGSGNKSIEPKFENSAAGNFRLRPESQLIDSGTMIEDLNSDFEGNLRNQGKSIDIGAFEHQDNSTSSINANAGSDQTICQGESVTLTASGGSSYSWNTGATTKSITVSPNTTTIYTVTVTEGSESDSDNVEVTVNSVTANAGSDKTINEGENITLTASGGSSYSWNTGATTKSITVNPNTTTTYSVTVINNGCEDMDEATVTVNQNNNSGVNANAGSDQTICQGESVTLTASGGSGYSWNTGATTKSITVNPNTTTTYTVTVTEGSESDSDNVEVVVNSVIANAGSNKTMNEGENITLNASGGNTYLWDTGAKTQSITVSPQETRNYSVTVYKNNCQDTDIVQVTVIENDTRPPPAKADAGEDVTICLGESVKLNATGGGTYLWSTGEASKSINVNPTRTTTYTLTATRGGITNSDTVVVTVENCSVLSGENNLDEFIVYPNPTKDILNIRAISNFELLNLNIYNINGSVVYSGEIKTNNNVATKTVDLSTLARGVYIVRMFNPDYHKTKKVLLY